MQRQNNNQGSSSTTIDMSPKPKFAQSVQNNAKKVTKAAASVWEDFRDFINKGNIMDLAVGVVMGASFAAVVNSMVKDMITPVISLGLDSVSLDNSFFIIGCPKDASTGKRPSLNSCSKNYTTVQIAQAAGAVTWNYGAFINQCITFVITSLIVYLILKAYIVAFKREKKKVTEKPCPHCLKEIPLEATRCAYCTSSVHSLE